MEHPVVDMPRGKWNMSLFSSCIAIFTLFMLIRTAVFVDKSTPYRLLLLTFYSFNCPKFLLHIFTRETLLLKWSVVLGSQLMYFLRYFPLNFAIFKALHE